MTGVIRPKRHTVISGAAEREIVTVRAVVPLPLDDSFASADAGILRWECSGTPPSATLLYFRFNTCIHVVPSSRRIWARFATPWFVVATEPSTVFAIASFFASAPSKPAAQFL
jgi:hypothetical protein